MYILLIYIILNVQVLLTLIVWLCPTELPLDQSDTYPWEM
jgi:hypothetical protein